MYLHCLSRFGLSRGAVFGPRGGAFSVRAAGRRERGDGERLGRILRRICGEELVGRFLYKMAIIFQTLKCRGEERETRGYTRRLANILLLILKIRKTRIL